MCNTEITGEEVWQSTSDCDFQL